MNPGDRGWRTSIGLFLAVAISWFAVEMPKLPAAKPADEEWPRTSEPTDEFFCRLDEDASQLI